MLKIMSSALTFLILSLIPIAWSVDVSLKGDGCSKFDRCTAEDSFRTCSCSADCHKYHTCCIDADEFPDMESQTPSGYQCQDDRTATPVFAKRSCTETFIGHDAHVISCTSSEADRADVLGNMLVTSSETGTTYWNRDCALCNSEQLDDLREWTVQVTCPSKHGGSAFTKYYIQNHLNYSRDLKEWGLQIGKDFVTCQLNFFQPGEVVGKLPYCAPNVVSSCPTNYTDSETVKLCGMYHGERRQKNTNRYFRNVHCAVCNGLGPKDLDCLGRNYRPNGIKSGKDFIKVAFMSGRWLEREGAEKWKCSHGFGWDPFWQRCRRVDNLHVTEAMSVDEAKSSADTALLSFGLAFVNVAVMFVMSKM